MYYNYQRPFWNNNLLRYEISYNWYICPQTKELGYYVELWKKEENDWIEELFMDIYKYLWMKMDIQTEMIRLNQNDRNTI